jgi:hypothetical protein
MGANPEQEIHAIFSWLHFSQVTSCSMIKHKPDETTNYSPKAHETKAIDIRQDYLF